MKPSLEVYVIHWNAPKWCASAVASLAGSGGVRVNITVIDNGQDGGPALGSLLPADVRILQLPENLGYAGGANAALSDWRSRFPESDLCVVASHDLHVESDTLSALVEAAEHSPSYGVLAPLLLFPFESSGGVWTGTSAYQLPVVSGRGVIERDWVSGSCLLLRADCVQAVSGFDASFGSYVEDVDFCLRARDAGWKVGVVVHAVARGLGSASDRSWAMIEANTAVLAWRRGGASKGIRALGQLITWTLRTVAATLAFWRSPAERRLSANFLRRHALALHLLARYPFQGAKGRR